MTADQETLADQIHLTLKYGNHNGLTHCLSRPKANPKAYVLYLQDTFMQVCAEPEALQDAEGSLAVLLRLRPGGQNIFEYMQSSGFLRVDQVDAMVWLSCMAMRPEFSVRTPRLLARALAEYLDTKITLNKPYELPLNAMFNGLSDKDFIKRMNLLKIVQHELVEYIRSHDPAPQDLTGRDGLRYWSRQGHPDKILWERKLADITRQRWWANVTQGCPMCYDVTFEKAI